MKFQVERASTIRESELNVEEAIGEVFSEDKWGKHKRYFVEINTLEELLAFSDKYGGVLILTTRDEDHGDKYVSPPHINIYDDYVE